MESSRESLRWRFAIDGVLMREGSNEIRGEKRN